MKRLNPTQFMNERKVGLLVRGFARRSQDVPDRVAMMRELIAKARAADVAGFPFIKRVDVLVWASQDEYPDQCDCGELAPALRELYRDDRRVFVHEVRTGDLFCSLLNYGIAKQLRAGCDYSVIASAEANAYWGSDVPTQMARAAGAGARAIGVAINELTESVLAGRIANTMAMWHLESLVTVGAFDLRAQKPRNDQEARFMRGTGRDGTARMYHLAGVEEVIPLARLVDTFGPCIAPIVADDEHLRYRLPDAQADPEGYEAHLAKFGTKLERQIAFLSSVDSDLSHLHGGVMPDSIQ